MELTCGPYLLSLIDEPTNTAGSADNACVYDREWNFASKEYRPSSKHGLLCREASGTQRSCILLGGGGPSGVHDHSMTAVGDCCFVAVGDTLCALALPSLDLRWHRTIDPATCFGVYYSPKHQCLLSHGECEIARVSLAGEVMWRTGGKDIFTQGFRVFGDHVEAVDFNGEVYRIDIATGTGRCSPSRRDASH